MNIIGQCLMKLDDLDKAKDYANKAVKIGKHEMCYAFLIKILTTEGDLNSAVALSMAAVEWVGSFHVIDWNKISVYVLTNSFFRFCPDSIPMLTECGILHLKLGQIQQAVEKLRSALALDPAYKKALLAIGYITQVCIKLILT